MAETDQGDSVFLGSDSRPGDRHVRSGGQTVASSSAVASQLSSADVRARNDLFRSLHSGRAIYRVYSRLEQQAGSTLHNGRQFPAIAADGIHCCRFDKTTGGFSHHWWPSEALRPAWRAFVALRELYDLQREMKALAA